LHRIRGEFGQDRLLEIDAGYRGRLLKNTEFRKIACQGSRAMRCACAKTDRIGACTPQEKFAAVQRYLPASFDASSAVQVQKRFKGSSSVEFMPQSRRSGGW
jgi:hypothetical protein